MEGRIRLVTAITPSYAHAYQILCATRRPVDIPNQGFRLPSAKGKKRTFQTAGPTRRTKVMTSRDGLCSPMEEPIPSMVKPLLVGSLSPAQSLEDFISSFVWSLPLQLTFLRMQGLAPIPTTPQSSRVSLRHCLFLDLQAPSPAAHKRASSMTRNMRPTYV